jgi:hypothetical protein
LRRKVGEVDMKKDFIVRRSITMVEGKPHVETYSEQELIRCKDCKNACVYDDDEVICTHIDSNGNDKHPADWFCADGERKAGR